MLYPLYKYFKDKTPQWRGLFFKLFFQSAQLKIGKNFKCDTFPDLTITQNGKITIGDNVLLRRNVELRAHQHSHIFIGDNIRIDRGVRILSTNESTIQLKDGVRIGLYTVFNGGDSIHVGENTLISGFVYLQTSMHRYKGEGLIQKQGYDHAPIHLEKDVWLGAHVVILPNVNIEQGSIVGSNAVVTKSIAKNTIVGGVPAKILKER